MLKEILWKTEDIKEATKAKQDELEELREARRLREVDFFQKKKSLISFLLKYTKINVCHTV